jgi:hypothetical protein
MGYLQYSKSKYKDDLMFIRILQKEKPQVKFIASNVGARVYLIFIHPDLVRNYLTEKH